MPLPIAEYFVVSFEKDHAGRFAMQLLNAVSSSRGLLLFANGPRPVAFQSMGPQASDHAFISPGAAQLLVEIGAPFSIDHSPVALADLPDGLALLVGEQSDLIAYYNRKGK